MYSDLNDTGEVPEDNGQNIALFSTKKMTWQLKSSNCSGNLSATAVFQLTHYDGLALDSSSNIEISVIQCFRQLTYFTI